MEENIQNQPEDITNDAPVQDDYVSPDEVDINLDEDYVMNWDNANENTEDNAVQIGETEEVSLGQRAEDSEEVDGGLRVESDQEGDANEGQSEEEGDVDDSIELGQVQQYEDEDEDPRYSSESENVDEYEEDYEDDEDYEEDEWDKMFDFMEEFPGSTPEDYVRMTSGSDEMSDEDILKIHLASEHGLDYSEDKEELDFLYEDKFGFDEELDSERDVKLKKLEAKKALRSAKESLSDMQLKYGADLKFGSESPELKELQAFQQEQVEAQQYAEELASGFQENTRNYFNQEFKGFEFNYGDGKSQRIKANPEKTADFQSDITNFISQYTNENGEIDNLAGYHKALWAAQNADALFSHAYEQGKADAVRSAARTAKNIDMDPRSDRSAESENPSSRFKLVDEGQHTENFNFKLKNY